MIIDISVESKTLVDQDMRSPRLMTSLIQYCGGSKKKRAASRCLNSSKLRVRRREIFFFLLDAGLKYPSVELYGIDNVIPDITYLIENKDHVQGIFLSHCHEEHIGAIPELLKNLDVGVFGTHFTISLVEEVLNEAGMNISNHRLYRINQDKVLKFGHITVEFFNIVLQ